MISKGLQNILETSLFGSNTYRYELNANANNVNKYNVYITLEKNENYIICPCKMFYNIDLGTVEKNKFVMPLDIYQYHDCNDKTIDSFIRSNICDSIKKCVYKDCKFYVGEGMILDEDYNILFAAAERIHYVIDEREQIVIVNNNLLKKSTNDLYKFIMNQMIPYISSNMNCEIVFCDTRKYTISINDSDKSYDINPYEMLKTNIESFVSSL